MIRSLQAGATSLNALTEQHELIASNLANLNSTGFRRAILAVEEKQVAGETDLNGVQIAARGIDFSAGPTQFTGAQFDLAIAGDGFFAVETPEGTRYTRAGSFHRDPATGQLQNSDGFALVSGSGPLTIDAQLADSEINIDPSGSVSARGQLLGTIGLTRFSDNRQLIPSGQVYFEAPPEASSETSSAQILVGHLENSNSQPVTELINLILTSRMFEATERTIRTIGDTIQLHFRV